MPKLHCVNKEIFQRKWPNGFPWQMSKFCPCVAGDISGNIPSSFIKPCDGQDVRCKLYLTEPSLEQNKKCICYGHDFPTMIADFSNEKKAMKVRIKISHNDAKNKRERLSRCEICGKWGRMQKTDHN